MHFPKIAFLLVATSAMYDGPKFASRKPSKELSVIPSEIENKPKMPSWYTKPKLESKKPKQSVFPKVSPMEAHDEGKKTIKPKVGVMKRVIVTKIVYVGKKPSTPSNDPKKKSDMEKMQELREMTERMMKDPELKGEWWPIGKPNKENPNKDKDKEKKVDDSNKKQRKMIADFYKRKLQKNKPKIPSYHAYKPSSSGPSTRDLRIMNFDDDPLDLVEERDNNSSMQMQIIRKKKNDLVEEKDDEDPEFRIPFKKEESFFEKLKKKVEKVFNSSLEEPVARFLVALTFGLMTTLSVFAVASLVTLLFPKLFDEDSSDNEAKCEYGGRSNSSVEYTPLPQSQ